MLIGSPNHHRAQLSQFVVQKTRGTVTGHRPKGVTTNQFCQTVGVVGGAAALGTHLMQDDGQPRLGNLPSRFGSGQTATNHLNGLFHNSVFAHPRSFTGY
jgi:hypothetical protein